MLSNIRLVGLWALSAAQAVGAAVTSTTSTGSHLAETLSLGSFVAAIGAVYVTREKTIRNEKDMADHKNETAVALARIADEFKAELASQRKDARDDLLEIRTDIKSVIASVGRIEGAVKSAAHRYVYDKDDRDES